MLVTRTHKESHLLALFHKILMKFFTHAYATNTVTVLALHAIELLLVGYFQLLGADVLRDIALTVTAM